MIENSINVKQLKKNLNLKIINEDKISDWRTIESTFISSVSLEMANLIPKKNLHKRIVDWGNKVLCWFKTLDQKNLYQKIESILKEKPPLLLINKKYQGIIYKMILSLCNKYNIPLVVLSDLLVGHSIIKIYLITHFSESAFIHGSFVIVNGVGVVIIGSPSVGKSEAALELIQKNHIFISDDSVVVKRLGEKFFGYPAPITRDLLEARGIGIINIKQIFGTKSIRSSGIIDLVVELVDSNNASSFDRLGNQKLKYEILNGKIDKIKIPVSNGRNVWTLIEVAANKYITQKYNKKLNPLDLLIERTKNE